MSSFLPAKQADNSDIRSAFELLVSGFFAEGFLKLQNLSEIEKPAPLFNLGLCYLHCENFDLAAEFFEKSLLAIKKNGALTSVPKNDVYIKLREKEITEKAYLYPMSDDFSVQFTEQAKENIILALIDASLALSLTEKAKKLSNSLIGEEFTKVKWEINSRI